MPIVNIDHHMSNLGFGSLDWIDPGAAATCEMDTLLMPLLGVRLDAVGGAIAANLMAGVVIDTANFQHPNVTPRTLRVAASCAPPVRRCTRSPRLYRTKPNAQLKLFGLVLARLETALDGRLLWSDAAARGLPAAAPRRRCRRGSSTCSASRERRDRDHLQDKGERDPAQRPHHATAASTRPS